MRAVDETPWRGPLRPEEGVRCLGGKREEGVTRFGLPTKVWATRAERGPQGSTRTPRDPLRDPLVENKRDRRFGLFSVRVPLNPLEKISPLSKREEGLLVMTTPKKETQGLRKGGAGVHEPDGPPWEGLTGHRKRSAMRSWLLGRGWVNHGGKDGTFIHPSAPDSLFTVTAAAIYEQNRQGEA